MGPAAHRRLRPVHRRLVPGGTQQPGAVHHHRRPDSLLEGEIIDLNTAAPEDLERLPGIGPAKAEAIAAYRTEHGPFRTVDQLMEVSGIGEATLEALRPYITASAPG